MLFRSRYIKARLAPSAQSSHQYRVSFLAGVTVPPGVPLTEKPFHLITLDDIEIAVTAKRTKTVKTYQKGEKRGRGRSAAMYPVIDCATTSVGCGIGHSQRGTPRRRRLTGAVEFPTN